MQVTWEKGGNVALREEVPKVCLELQVSQVSVWHGMIRRSW